MEWTSANVMGVSLPPCGFRANGPARSTSEGRADVGRPPMQTLRPRVMGLSECQLSLQSAIIGVVSLARLDDEAKW